MPIFGNWWSLFSDGGSIWILSNSCFRIRMIQKKKERERKEKEEEEQKSVSAVEGKEKKAARDLLAEYEEDGGNW